MPKAAGFKKRKKGVKKIGLSFGDEEDEDEGGMVEKAKTRPSTHNDDDDNEEATTIVKKRLKPSSSVAVQAKAQTKSALAKEALLKETLRKQYMATNEAVRSTEFVLPFVFFEAKDMAGAKVRLKKGDFVWLFLERARKVGIELGERGEGPMGLGGRRREWARIGVDDLMVVVGEMMLPHVSSEREIVVDNRISCNELTILSTAPRLPHPHPQQIRRLQRRLVPLLLRANISNASTPRPSCGWILASSPRARRRSPDRPTA
jgi:protein FAM50